MNRLAGYLLMTVAIGHALVGLILYRGSLGAIWLLVNPCDPRPSSIYGSGVRASTEMTK